MIKLLTRQVLRGGSISREEAAIVSAISHADIFDLLAATNKIRAHFRGDTAGLCSIVNAKSGACPEDCSFCAQSTKSKANIDVYPLLKKEAIIGKAVEAKNAGATEVLYCHERKSCQS